MACAELGETETLTAAGVGAGAGGTAVEPPQPDKNTSPKARTNRSSSRFFIISPKTQNSAHDRHAKKCKTANCDICCNFRNRLIAIFEIAVQPCFNQVLWRGNSPILERIKESRCDRHHICTHALCGPKVGTHNFELAFARCHQRDPRLEPKESLQ